VRIELNVLRAGLRWAAPAFAVLLLVIASPAWSAPDPAEVREALRRAVEQLRSTGRVTLAGQKVLSVESLPEMYASLGFTPIWKDPASEAALLGEIAAVSGDGLDRSDYHFEALRALIQRRDDEPDSAGLAATADLLMSDALIRLVAHFHAGKLDPETRDPRWDLPERIRGEPGAQVVIRIASGQALPLQLNELRPKQAFYGRLKSALARYRVVAQEGGWTELPRGRALQVGMEDPRVPLLRRRLAQSGDLPGVVVDSPLFEEALDEALRRFQARHGLEADGVLGPASLRALNLPVEQRIDTLRANLERARWLLTDVRGRFLVLDPAGERVLLMDNSASQLTLTAAFSPAARAAGDFAGAMPYVVVNPDWILPPALVRDQVAPLARRRPGTLDELGLQVFDAEGQPSDGAQANWSGSSRLIIRQLPGTDSFLGAFRFPVSGDTRIFLHGAPAEGDSIAGSVRLEAPQSLARALASPPQSWTPEMLAAALAEGEPVTLPLAAPLSVLHAHWSAWVESDGRVSFRQGLEARDAEIVAGLKRAPAPR